MIEIFDPRFSPAASGAGQLERLCTGASWSEGPVWMPQDGAVLWSDIPNNRILRWHPSDGMTVWRERAGFTNGHALESDGSLLHCSHGARSIIRTQFDEQQGTLVELDDEVIADRYQGRRLNSPNDIVVKSDGTIWFSDPPYGIISNEEGYEAPRELRHNYVFRLDPRNGALTIVSDFVEEPNGLAFSPDENLLYVSDTSRVRRTPSSGNPIVVFDVVNGRDLANPRDFVFVEPGLADGFRVDRNGFLFTSAGDAVQVFHPDGALCARIPIPERVGNLTFGGAAGNELFICATSSLYRIRLNTSGATR